jgi:hypothetical protein
LSGDFSRPREALDQRIRLSLYREELLELAKGVFPSGGGRAADALWAAVVGGETWYVESDFCQLITAALETWPHEPLLPTDVPVPSGFVLFEEALTKTDAHGNTLAVRGAVWSGDAPELAFGEPETEMKSGLLFVWLGHGGDHDDYADQMPTLLANNPAYYSGLHFYSLGFHAYSELEESRFPTEGTILQVLWRLTNQRIPFTSEESMPRQLRRQGERKGLENADKVVVMRLPRRESGLVGGAEGGLARYSHRFIVSGHWRNQFYPSLAHHRQIWIAPFVKGDPELPLVVKERAVLAEAARAHAHRDE